MLHTSTAQNIRVNSLPGQYCPAPAHQPVQRRTAPPQPFPGSLKALPRDLREDIEQKLSFLLPVYKHLHSVVIVGSTVFGKQSKYSDLDVVIITTPDGYEQVCCELFEEEFRLDTSDRSFDCTVLTPAETEKLFQISSPFAYSILFGSVFRDDGFLAALRKREYLCRPGREYYSFCLAEKIIIPYYMALREYRNSADELNDQAHRGDERKINHLHTVPEQFARLIIHMLYVTLPSQGMIPLTKNDIIDYAGKAYGSEGKRMAQRVLALVRHQPVQFSGDENRLLKKFAVRLFREILHFMGISNEVRFLITDAVNMLQGRHHAIKNEAVRNCLV